MAGLDGQRGQVVGQEREQENEVMEDNGYGRYWKANLVI